MNIKLKELKPRDFSNNYFEWINDNKVMQFTSFENKKTTKKNIINYIKSNCTDKHNYLFGIYYHNKHVGNIKAGNINYNHNTCEISYFLGDLKNRRKGIMYKSIIKLIDQLNKSKKLIKFTAYTYVINKPSIKLLTKIGFKIEGRLKRHHYYNGKRRDILIFSYLKN